MKEVGSGKVESRRKSKVRSLNAEGRRKSVALLLWCRNENAVLSRRHGNECLQHPKRNKLPRSANCRADFSSGSVKSTSGVEDKAGFTVLRNVNTCAQGHTSTFVPQSAVFSHTWESGHIEPLSIWLTFRATFWETEFQSRGICASRGGTKKIPR